MNAVLDNLADEISRRRNVKFELKERAVAEPTTMDPTLRAALLKRRLDEALRLMLEDNKDERSLKEIARCCGFGGTSQFNRAFHPRYPAWAAVSARFTVDRMADRYLDLYRSLLG